MNKIDRRQFVVTMAAAACAATKVKVIGAFAAADQPWAYPNGLWLLASSNHRVSDMRPGWLAIVAAALEKMNTIDPDLEIRQIKQKFGGLRIYYNSKNWEQLRPAVQEAELLCEKTCEECGRTGKLFDQNGCIRTLCKEHQAVRSPEISVIALPVPIETGDSCSSQQPVECDVHFIYVERQRRRIT